MPLSLARLLSRAAATSDPFSAPLADPAAVATDARTDGGCSEILGSFSARSKQNSEACVADVKAGVLAARVTLEGTVKINVMGLGRVRDLFEQLAEQTAARVESYASNIGMDAQRQLTEQTGRHEQELASVRSKAEADISELKAAHESSFAARLESEISGLRWDRDTSVAEANAREKQVRQELNALIERTSDSESLIRQGEEALEETKVYAARLRLGLWWPEPSKPPVEAVPIAVHCVF